MGPKYFVTGALGLIETANKRSLRRNQMRPDGMGEAFHRTRVFFSFFFLFFFNLPGSFFYLFPFSCRYRVSEGSFPYFVFLFLFFFLVRFSPDDSLLFALDASHCFVFSFTELLFDLSFIFLFFFSSFLETSFLERPRVKSRAKRIEVFKF